MKLASSLVERTSTQIEAQAIPENHPAAAQLNELFGDHTFFLDSEGLEIVEPGEPAASGARTGTVVRLASWNDESRTALAPHPPEPTDIVVLLGPDDGEDAA